MRKKIKERCRVKGVGYKEWRNFLCKGKNMPIQAIVNAHEQMNHHNKVGPSWNVGYLRSEGWKKKLIVIHDHIPPIYFEFAY
jgi:hypothetical protein